MKKHLISVTAACTAFIIVSAQEGQAVSDEPSDAVPDWLESAYPYSVVDQALADVFTEFGRNLGVSIETSRQVGSERVRRYSHDGSADQFLGYLVGEYDLDWVYDGGRLYVSSIGERISRSWPGDAGSVQGAKTALAEAGLDDPRYQIGIGTDQGVLSLTAPPRYMSQAAPVIERMLAPKSTQTVRVIHGRTRDGGT